MDESDVFHGNKIRSDVSRCYGKAMNSLIHDDRHKQQTCEKNEKNATLKVTTLF